DIRERPSHYGIMKVTIDAVEAVITEEETYQQAKQDLIASEYKVDMLEAAVKALDHRKKALENLVYLHGQSYFAEPRDRSGSMDEAVKDQTRRRGQTTRRT